MDAQFTFKALNSLVLSNKVTDKNEVLINLTTKLTSEMSFEVMLVTATEIVHFNDSSYLKRDQILN